MASWRYPVALGGILVALGGAVFVAFRAVGSAATDANAQLVTLRTLPSVLVGPPDSADPATKTAPLPPRLPVATATAPAPPPPPVVAEAPQVTAAATPQPVWQPSPEQLLRDSLYILRASQPRVAIALLTRWLDRHPSDAVHRLERARLLRDAGDVAAWDDYARLEAQTGDTAIAAEHATARLNAGDHAAAAAAFARLLNQHPARHDWRLGGVRAYARNAQPRQALALLEAHPGSMNPEERALRHELRTRVEPTAAEAARWVAADSGVTVYRLALARALVAGGRLRDAMPQYARVVNESTTVPLLHEAVGVAAAVESPADMARLTGQLVALSPGDTAIQRRHAAALAWSGDVPGAISAYDRLLASGARPEDLRGRAGAKVRAGDNRGALNDLRAAESSHPTPQGQVLVGDLHRWLGERQASRAAYGRARQLDPTVRGVEEGLQDLRRTAVRDLPWDSEEGTAVSWDLIEDNTGFALRGGSIRHGVPLGEMRRTVVTAGASLRDVVRDAPPASGLRTITTWGGDLGVAHTAGRTRLGARLGQASFDRAGSVFTWLGTVERRTAGGLLAASVSRGPAFETLRAGATLGIGLPSSNDTVLTSTSGMLTFSRPLGTRGELWTRGEFLGLDDGNARTMLQLALRGRVSPNLSVVYSGGLLGFRNPAISYWSPRRYSLHGLGLEFARSWANGLFLRAQGLPGVAWYDQAGIGGARDEGRAVQWQFTGEYGWRATRWDVGLTSAFGQDRGGTYEAWTGLARVRYRW